MKRILILLILLIFIPQAAAGNVTIKGVDFEIPNQYDHGTLKDTSYVYQSGLKFRILNLDDSKNLRINYEYDIANAKGVEQREIAGHDAVVISKEYNSKPYTVVYFASGNHIFLVCFNDTSLNSDIFKMIENTPQQIISHDNFTQSLNQALSDYESQISAEKESIRQEDNYKNNEKPDRFFFFLR